MINAFLIVEYPVKLMAMGGPIHSRLCHVMVDGKVIASQLSFFDALEYVASRVLEDDSVMVQPIGRDRKLHTGKAFKRLYKSLIGKPKRERASIERGAEFHLEHAYKALLPLAWLDSVGSYIISYTSEDYTSDGPLPATWSVEIQEGGIEHSAISEASLADAIEQVKAKAEGESYRPTFRTVVHPFVPSGKSEGES